MTKDCKAGYTHCEHLGVICTSGLGDDRVLCRCEKHMFAFYVKREFIIEAVAEVENAKSSSEVLQSG